MTWLYGPLHTSTNSLFSAPQSPPPSQLSTSSSFLQKKPILKKKSASETILQRSLSDHNLLQQAGAILQSQRSTARPAFERAGSDLLIQPYCPSSAVDTPAADDGPISGSQAPSRISSGLTSPGERRHIHFNNEVVQCIAVESKDEDDEEGGSHALPGEEEDDEDDLVMMKPVSPKARVGNRSALRSSFGAESKTIAPLPSTTLKYRSDTPEPEAQQNRATSCAWAVGHTLLPSPSQETLRPPNPTANFLIDDDDDYPELQWQPSGHASRPSTSGPYYADDQREDEYGTPGPGMRRTPSGMFMPYEDEDEAAMNEGLFGRVLNTVNTARDIAHVIWNVGWRR